MPRRRTNRTLAPKRSARDWGPKFLARLSRCGNVCEAAKAAGAARSTVYLRRDGDPAFAKLMALALDDADDRLEAEARKRALRKSDRLLMFLLQVRRYGKRSVQVDVTSGGKALERDTLTAADLAAATALVVEAGGLLRADGEPQPVDTAPAALAAAALPAPG